MPTPPIAFGPFVFDPDSRLLKRDGSELPLPPRVTGVLEVLLRRPGDVVLRQELMDSVWKDAFVTDTSLAEAVSVLRQTLGDDPQAPAYIQTLHRRGYRWVAPVVERPGDRGTVPFSGTLPRFTFHRRSAGAVECRGHLRDPRRSRGQAGRDDSRRL